jgi:hypothetical protein
VVLSTEYKAYTQFKESSLVGISEGITLIVKVNFALEQAMKAQRGSRGIALLFL